MWKKGRIFGFLFFHDLLFMIFSYARKGSLSITSLFQPLSYRNLRYTFSKVPSTSTRVTGRTMTSASLNDQVVPLPQLPARDNTVHKYLKAEDVEPKRGDKIYPRQVKGVHYTYVLPEPVRKPELVIASEDCARSLGLDPSETRSQLFAEVFGGNNPIPGFDLSYATVYGCHCYGQWFGQNGDGRAIILGEVHYHYDLNGKDYYTNGIQELQLKGAGRTPYSRGFDGRAVLRSSIREFLASEFMFHLGVPTTRALSVSDDMHVFF